MEWTEFLYAGANSGKLNVISIICGRAWSKTGMVILFLRPLNLLNEFMNWADFLHADCDSMVFSYTDIVLYILDF